MTLEFKPYWKKSVQQIMDNAPDGWDIIQLCYISTSGVPSKMYTKNPGNLFSTGAYLINKQNLKTNSTKYDLRPDFNHAADNYLFALYKTFVYKYPMFIYKDNQTSTIHSDHITIHNKSKNDIIQSLHFQ